MHILGSEFLPDPGDFFGGSNQHLVRTSELATNSFAVLGGEPGIGKSTELRRIREQLEKAGKTVLAVHCRQFPDTAAFVRQVFESDEWKRMEQGKPLSLLIDGVDEGFFSLPGFIAFLQAELQRRDVSQLQLFLACRTAHWPLTDGAKLAALWPKTSSGTEGEGNDSQIFELARLRIEDVREATEAYGLAPDKFLQEVGDKQIEALAAQPITLFFLLREFVGGGTLPGSRQEIYEKGIRQLCEEPNLERTQELRRLSPGLEIPTVDQAYRVAARIAAMAIVGAKAAVFMGKEYDSTSGDLHRAEIAGGGEVADGNQFNVTPQLVDETLRRPLFESKGENRNGFLHLTFAEYLAARYLVPLSVTQLRQLLCQNDGEDEAIIPQLQEVAAWLATIHEAWRDYLLKRHSEVLFQTDISALAEGQKIKVIGEMIERMTQNLVSRDYYSTEFLRSIKYPGLADRLRQIINDREWHRSVREFAFAAAGQCNLQVLADDVLAVCVDPQEDESLRRRAGECLIQLLPEGRLDDLVPFAKGDVAADSDDSCKGYAIQALVPRKWELEEVLPYLSDPKRPTYFGEYYWVAAYYLPRLVRRENVVAVLRFVGQKPECLSPGIGNNWFDRLANEAVRVALENLNDAAITAEMGELLLSKSRQNGIQFSDGEDGTRQILETQPSKRRALLAVILNNVETGEKDVAMLEIRDGLLRSADLEWILVTIGSVPQPRRRIWALAIRQIRYMGNVTSQLDLFLQKMDEVPELKAEFEVDFAARLLGSPEAERERMAWLEDEEMRQKFVLLTESRRPRAMIDSALRIISSVDRWIALSEALRNGGGTEDNFDPVQAPVWGEITNEVRNQIREVARRFLLDAEAPPVWWDRYHPNYFPAYHAARFLFEDLRLDANLKRAVETKWFSVLLDYPAYATDHHGQMVAFLIELDSERCYIWLAEKLDLENANGNMCSVQFLRSFAKVWNRRIAAMLERVIQDKAKEPTLRAAVFNVLLQCETDRAVELLVEQVRAKKVAALKSDFVVIAGMVTAIIKAPRAVWSELWPPLEKSPPLAKAVFGRILQNAWKSQSRLTELTPRQMAELYLLLDRIFPVVAGSNIPSDSRILQSELLKAITRSGTKDGCDALRELAAAKPDESVWIMHKYRECLKIKRQSEWRPPAPEVIRKMVRERRARFVETPDALQEAVLESLERFQAHLTQSEIPAVSHLWNYHGGGQRRSNFAPKDEEDLSDELRRWLIRDLSDNKAVVLNREVQIRRGQRLDILVQALSASDSILTCIVEVKGCWNSGVKDAISSQLAKDYLEANGHTHGIYVVGWYLCDRWDEKSSGPKVCLDASDFDSATEEVVKLAAPFDGKATRLNIKALLLDCRYFEKAGKKAKKKVKKRKNSPPGTRGKKSSARKGAEIPDPPGARKGKKAIAVASSTKRRVVKRSNNFKSKMDKTTISKKKMT